MPQAKKTSAKSAKSRKSRESSAASLRETLTRGIFLTRERINDTLEDAVRRGRITRDDAEQLAASLVGVGRRQAEDLLAELEQLLVRRVDRVRRTAGVGPAFPILGYDDLTAAQVAERLSELSPAQLRKVRDHERRHANRKSVLTAIERALR
jgi:hypothetical protein